MFKNPPEFTEYLEFLKKYYTEKSVTGIKLENYRLCFYDPFDDKQEKGYGWIDVCCGLNAAIKFCEFHGLKLQARDLIFSYVDHRRIPERPINETNTMQKLR